MRRDLALASLALRREIDRLVREEGPEIAALALGVGPATLFRARTGHVVRAATLALLREGMLRIAHRSEVRP